MPTRVSDLMNPATGDWDTDLVHDMFWEEDAKLIRENEIAWHYDKKGCFSVRSAYKVFRNGIIRSNRRQSGSTSSNTGNSGDSLWTKIWNLKVPGKIKHFLWRVAHNSQALRRNLHHRGMDINTKCLLYCQCSDEDGGHLFFKCKLVKPVWRELCLEKERAELKAISTAQKVVEYVLEAKEETQIKIAVLMWSWWSERNGVREGDMPRSAASIAHCVAVYTLEILKVFLQQKERAIVSRKRWCKPNEGILKINCDAAFCERGRNGGWGYVIRDADGDVVSAGRGRLDHVIDSFQAEVIACLQGLQAAVELGIGRAIVESDALQVIQACTSTTYDLSSAGNLISELLHAAHVNFQSLQFVYIPRSCNKVADTLAALGSLCGDEAETVVPVLPSCIRVLVANDLAPVE